MNTLMLKFWDLGKRDLALELCIFYLFCQEINFYKVIDYILHGKEDIKVIP